MLILNHTKSWLRLYSV